VVLADDHAPILASVSRLLAHDFDVVAAVTDGRQALDVSLQLDPDVVVLDIMMPKLNGFQALDQLRRRGSRARVVFLSMHQTDEHVATAIGSGAQGYVLKTRIYPDLTSAIDHVLEGRLFFPSLASCSAVAASSGAHAAQFHANDRHFLDEVSGFVGATLRGGGPVVVAATEETRLGIARRLSALRVDVAALERRGQYLVLDAAESLAQFMRDGRADADRLAEIVHDLERSRLAFCDSADCRLTIFGEMAVLLCRNGEVEAALNVEQIWNRLTRSLPFLTVCSYPIECFRDPAHAKLFPDICGEHRAVIHGRNVT
jgi:DNA-binding NarL/FixJ family response regulator